MKMIATIISCICWSGICTAGQHQSADSLYEQPFTLKINTKALQQKTILYLVYRYQGKKLIDSAKQQHGVYLFKGRLDGPHYVTLVADHKRIGINQLIKKPIQESDVLRFYLYPAAIHLKIKGILAEAKFIGSDINTDHRELEKSLDTVDKKLKQLDRLLTISGDKQVVSQTVRKYDSLSLTKKPLLKSFIAKHHDSFIALIALQQYAGSFPDIAVIEPIFKRLSPRVRNMPLGKEFYKFLSDFKNLSPGGIAPDFTQNDTTGKPVKLSAFRGKYVLIDFWASWCGPCRAANPELTKIYKEFGDKNFTILGISLDGEDDRQRWLNAIKEDGLSWTQLSDLRHWNNQVAKLYSIRAVPQSFLIDPKGVIVAKNLNNEQLRAKLMEILSEK